VPDLLDIPVRGASSVILVLFPSGGPSPIVEAFDAPARDLAVPVRAGAPVSDLYALRFACGLETLGLAEGQIVLTPASAAGAGPLPFFWDSVFAAHFSGSSATSSEDSSVPEQVLALAISNYSRCVDFTSTSSLAFSIADTATASKGLTVSAPFGQGSLLLGTRDGRFFVVDASGIKPEPALGTGTPHLGGYGVPGGEIWLIGAGGRTMHGPSPSALVPGPTTKTASPALPIRMTAAPPGQPFELFALYGDGSVERFDGSSWTISVGPGAPFKPTFVSAAPRRLMSWLSPGRVVLTGRRTPVSIDRLEADGSVVEEDVINDTTGDFDPSTGEIHSLARNPHGLIELGTRLSSLASRGADGRWTSETNGTVYDTDVRVIEPLDDGYLFGGSNGRFAQRHALAGEWCDQHALAPGDVDSIVALGPGLFAAIYHPAFGSDAAVQLIQRVSAPRGFCPAPGAM
jgi:hypothetical protein